MVSDANELELRQAINEVREMTLIVTTKFQSHEATCNERYGRIDRSLGAIHRGVIALLFMLISALATVLWYLLIKH